MTRRVKGLVYGAIVGAVIGLLGSAFNAPPEGSFYAPQTAPGWIAYYISYLIPFAALGSIMGIAASKKQISPAPVAAGEVAEMNKPAIPPRPTTTAVQRFGHVLGWTGTAIAIPLVALGFYGFTQEGGDSFIKGAAIVIGALAFLIGRALRYVFAGPA